MGEDFKPTFWFPNTLCTNTINSNYIHNFLIDTCCTSTPTAKKADSNELKINIKKSLIKFNFNL